MGGEISPQDTLISDNQDYRKLQHRQSQNKAELLEVLSDEQKELLENFCATEIELNGISEQEFIHKRVEDNIEAYY